MKSRFVIPEDEEEGVTKICSATVFLGLGNTLYVEKINLMKHLEVGDDNWCCVSEVRKTLLESDFAVHNPSHFDSLERLCRACGIPFPTERKPEPPVREGRDSRGHYYGGWRRRMERVVDKSRYLPDVAAAFPIERDRRDIGAVSCSRNNNNNPKPDGFLSSDASESESKSEAESDS